MIANVLTLTALTPFSYEFSAILVGESPFPPPEEFGKLGHKFRQYLVSAQILFWLAIFSVKFSFLFLYKAVFGTFHEYRAAFWFALGYTIVSFGLCLSNVLAWCGGDASNLFSFGKHRDDA